MHRLLLLLASLGWTTQLGAQSPASGFGVLAEMVEHDYLCASTLRTFRWQTPDKVIAMTDWAGGGRTTSEFEILPATNQVQIYNIGGLGRSKNGTLDVDSDGSMTAKGKLWLQKSSDGAPLFFGNTVCTSVPADHKTGIKLAELLSSGKLRPANPALAYRAPEVASPIQVASSIAGQTNSGETVVPEPTIVQAPISQPGALQTAVQVANSGTRVALIIGNSNYGASFGNLANPGNDARLIAEGLRAVGFDVELVIDADQKSMKRAISRLGERIALAGQGATGMFYYAGHGLQSRGVNYLIPKDAAIQREADVDLEAVAADTVLAQMEGAGAATNIVVLDACRNVPIFSSFRGGTRGLARMEAPNGSFISYSTAPGAVAYDGNGNYSAFAQALNAEFRKPGQPIEITFRNVRRMVLQETDGLQTPWDSSSLIDSFVFNPG